MFQGNERMHLLSRSVSANPEGYVRLKKKGKNQGIEVLNYSSVWVGNLSFILSADLLRYIFCRLSGMGKNPLQSNRCQWEIRSHYGSRRDTARLVTRGEIDHRRLAGLASTLSKLINPTPHNDNNAERYWDRTITERAGLYLRQISPAEHTSLGAKSKAEVTISGRKANSRLIGFQNLG